jgi:hypothetical protein
MGAVTRRCCCSLGKLVETQSPPHPSLLQLIADMSRDNVSIFRYPCAPSVF